MTITNHILAGSIIGLVVPNPVLAVVLAFASHFVMDALPHFGYPGKAGYVIFKYRLTQIVAVATFITSLAVIILLGSTGNWFALLTGLIAASPDAVGFYNYLKYERKQLPPTKLLQVFHVRFHRWIQWCEQPWGVVAEIFVSSMLLYVLWPLL